MALTPYKKAVATVGEYTDRTGATKKRYQSVGMLFKYDDGGMTLKLESIPAGNTWNGFISFFDIEDKTDKTTQRQSDGKSSNFDLDEESPF